MGPSCWTRRWRKCCLLKTGRGATTRSPAEKSTEERILCSAPLERFWRRLHSTSPIKSEKTSTLRSILELRSEECMSCAISTKVHAWDLSSKKKFLSSSGTIFKLTWRMRTNFIRIYCHFIINLLNGLITRNIQTNKN